jgi:RNA polymerase sigma factor (sigma-70 family)
MPEGDEQVVGRSEASAPTAFVELFWRHGDAVHAYLVRRTGRQDADDLLSEVWLRAFKGRANYDPRWPDARPWLYGIARHVLLAHWRRSGRPLVPLAEPAALDCWDEVDSRLDATGERARLQRVLATLSPDDREVLLLVTWEQLTPSEVAVALGIPQGTARSRLHRALSVFRREFEDESFVPVRCHPKEA